MKVGASMSLRGILMMALAVTSSEVLAQPVASKPATPSVGASAKSIRPEDFAAQLLRLRYKSMGASPKASIQSAVQSGPVMLVLWASWCDQCKWQLEKMSANVKARSKAGHEHRIFAINVDDNVKEAARHLKKVKYEFPVLRSAEKPSWEKHYKVLPVTLLFAKGGEFDSAYTGINGERWEGILKQFARLNQSENTFE